MFWPSLIYAFLSVAALAFWRVGVPCLGGTCGGEPVLLGRSVWLWAAFLYSAAALLCLAVRRKREFSVALLAGALLHWVVVGVAAALGSFCPVCARFAGLEAAAACLALLGSRGPAGARPFWTAGPLRALALASLALLAANPGGAFYAGLPEFLKSEAAVVADVTAPGSGTQAPARQEGGAGRTVRALDAAGNPVELDLAERPVLAFAWWCPHCDEALREVAKTPPSRRPVLAAAWPRGNGDAGKTEEKLAACGLAGESWFVLEDPAAAGVTGVPYLVVWEGGEKKVLAGNALRERLGSLAARLLGRAEVPNPPDAGGRNALRAAELIGGTVVPPGAEFSFNRAAGPYTEERGYILDASVVRGAYGLEQAPDVGGGVCRTATALYRAALAAGMELLERHEHGLPVWYAEPGGDAAVAWPHWDLRFRNTLGVPVEIRCRQDGGSLIAEIAVLAR